ncbi:MAG: hypothetical protein AMXMBFR64_37740 [Myxococcales bacterium]
MKRLVGPLLSLALSHSVIAAPTCPLPSYCTDMTTRPVFEYDFDVEAGKRYDVTTSDLQGVPGLCAADTVVWVIRKDTGNVVGVNDDWMGLASRVTFTPTTSFPARVIIAGYTWCRAGTADVSVQEDLVEILPSQLQQDQPFGGYMVAPFEAHPGDAVYVTPVGSQKPANTAYLFSSPVLDCESSCGSVDMPQLGFFKRIDVSQDMINGRLLVGTQSSIGGTRMIHAKLATVGWPDVPELDDLDGDGLTSEIEEILGTCDTASGPSPDCDECANGVFPADCPAGTCRCFGRRAGAGSGDSPWNPYDTDGDGISDLHEIFTIYLACDDPWEPPYYKRTCQDRTRLTPGCPAGKTCSEVLTSMWDLDPREYDVLLELDSYSGSSGDHFLTAGQQAVFQHIYSEEGLECAENTSTNPADCDEPPSYRKRIHVRAVHSEALSPEPTVGLYYTRLAMANVFFNRWFDRWRKASGVYRYGLMLPDIGVGQARLPGNRLVSRRNSRVLAHELGHNLGLRHGGGTDTGGKPNYPSLMDWSSYEQPPKSPSPAQSIWPADTNTCCVGGGDCSTAFCDAWDSAGCTPDPEQVCEIPRSEENARFSRGLHPVLDGFNGLSETGWSEKLATDTRTFSNYNGRNWYSPFCSGGTCSINWDRDGAIEGAPQQADLDLVPGIDERDIFHDFDDWERMYAKGRDGLGNMFTPNIRVYSASFNGNGLDYSGWQHTPTATAVTYDLTGTPNTGRYAVLNGTTSGIVLADHPSVQAMGATLQGEAPDGFRLDILFNLDPIASTTYVYLVDSDLFRLDLNMNQSTQTAIVRASVHNGSTWGSALSSPVVISPGTWYWAQVDWDLSRLRLRVIPWIVPAPPASPYWGDSVGACADAARTYVADRSPGAVAIGQSVTGTRRFKGRVDEARMWAYLPCEDFFSAIVCPADVAADCDWCPYGDACPDGGL